MKLLLRQKWSLMRLLRFWNRPVLARTLCSSLKSILNATENWIFQFCCSLMLDLVTLLNSTNSILCQYTPLGQVALREHSFIEILLRPLFWRCNGDRHPQLDLNLRRGREPRALLEAELCQYIICLDGAVKGKIRIFSHSLCFAPPISNRSFLLVICK